MHIAWRRDIATPSLEALPLLRLPLLMVLAPSAWRRDTAVPSLAGPLLTLLLLLPLLLEVPSPFSTGSGLEASTWPRLCWASGIE